MWGRYKNKVYSPCVAICSLDRAGEYCLGCARSVKEINDWHFLSDEEKREILKQLPERKKRILE